MFSPLFWLFDLCFRGITVNLFRRQLLHLVGYVGICVQGSSAGYITQNCRQGLDVHSVGLGVGCKSMARTMKSHPFTSRIIQNSVQALMGRGWTHGQVFFLWGWKHPRIKCSSAAFSSACRHRLRQHRIWLSAIPFPLAYSSGFIHTQICCLSFSVSLFSGISPSLGLMYSRRYPS